MWRLRQLKLSIPQRLLLLTIIPIVGLVVVGEMSFRTHYSEYKNFAADARAMHAFHREATEFVVLANTFGAERDAGLRLSAARKDPERLKSFQTRMAETDRAVAELMAKLDRHVASPQAALFTEKITGIRSFIAPQLAEARAGTLEARLTPGAVFYIYMKLVHSAFGVSECYRLMLSTPAALNIFDAVMALQKIQQQEFFVTSLAVHGLQNGGLQKDELAILRRQFFVSTENEYYMLKFQPEIRWNFRDTTRKSEDAIAFYAYLNDLAGKQLELTALPPFVPKAQPLAELIEQHFKAYDDVYTFAFNFADETLMAIAHRRQQRAFTIGGSLLAGIILSLGVNLAITRNTRRSLVTVTNNIAQASDDVKSASTQLTAAGERISEDATHYASAIEKIGVSLSEVSTVAETNKNHAAKAGATTTRVRDSVGAGLGTIQELDSAMNSARNSAQKINQIIARINDLSFQTNLLALNAAVEAARAGAAGAGFAVVADEVRRLAQRCAEAAKETAELIGDSSKDTAIAISKSDELAARFKNVSLNIHEVNETVMLLSTNFLQQAGSITEISHSVSKQREIAQSMAAAAQETASTAFSMEDQVESLRTSVERMDTLLGHTHSPRAAEGEDETPGDTNQPWNELEEKDAELPQEPSPPLTAREQLATFRTQPKTGDLLR
ncbi:MAG TPA: methyl-accepting chemotaxis protein [Opitutaceae bacterium]|nr:methyl-accepting chemotaxis protein [Opitutaceae bacterium]